MAILSREQVNQRRVSARRMLEELRTRQSPVDDRNWVGRTMLDLCDTVDALREFYEASVAFDQEDEDRDLRTWTEAGDRLHLATLALKEGSK